LNILSANEFSVFTYKLLSRSISRSISRRRPATSSVEPQPKPAIHILLTQKNGCAIALTRKRIWGGGTPYRVTLFFSAQYIYYWVGYRLRDIPLTSSIGAINGNLNREGYIAVAKSIVVPHCIRLRVTSQIHQQLQTLRRDIAYCIVSIVFANALSTVFFLSPRFSVRRNCKIN